MDSSNTVPTRSSLSVCKSCSEKFGAIITYDCGMVSVLEVAFAIAALDPMEPGAFLFSGVK